MRPGGRIGLANWTPEGFVGQLLALIGRRLPPPPGLDSPALWGTEPHIVRLFGRQAFDIRCERRIFHLRYHSPSHWLRVFRDYYGPTHQAFAALDGTGQRVLANDITELLERMNIGGEIRWWCRPNTSRSSSPSAEAPAAAAPSLRGAASRRGWGARNRLEPISRGVAVEDMHFSGRAERIRDAKKRSRKSRRPGAQAAPRRSPCWPPSWRASSRSSRPSCHAAAPIRPRVRSGGSGSSMRRPPRTGKSWRFDAIEAAATRDRQTRRNRNTTQGDRPHERPIVSDRSRCPQSSAGVPGGQGRGGHRGRLRREGARLHRSRDLHGEAGNLPPSSSSSSPPCPRAPSGDSR